MSERTVRNAAAVATFREALTREYREAGLAELARQVEKSDTRYAHIEPILRAFAALSPADGATGGIRAEVIEECARVADKRVRQVLDGEYAIEAALALLEALPDAIRFLTPTETGEQGNG